MLKLRRILLPVEFHERCLRVIGVADSIARRFHSEIVLLHVVSPESYSQQEWKNGRPVTGDVLLDELLSYAEKDLHETVRPWLKGLPVKGVVRRGDPSSEIIKVAEEETVDLIAMATRGRAGFYGHLIGSVTAKVMHESDKPVLTGTNFPEVSQQGGNAQHVLCGVTFSEHSLPTLKCAGRIADEFQAKLTIAHVTPNVDLYGPGGTYADPRWQQELVASAEELIGKVQEQTGVKGEAAVESGDPGAGLSKIGVRVGADLLVVGAHFGGGHLGANGYGILAGSKIPVLSV